MLSALGRPVRVYTPCVPRMGALLCALLWMAVSAKPPRPQKTSDRQLCPPQEPVCALDKVLRVQHARRNCTHWPNRCPVRCICGQHRVLCPSSNRSDSTRPNVTSSGGWSSGPDYTYLLDEKLVLAIVSLIGQTSSIIELGAGSGCYISALRRAGVQHARGYDYNAAGRSEGLVRHANLAERQKLGAEDWALSLEVGEHIPKASQSAFVQNLHEHNRLGIVISWAQNTAQKPSHDSTTGSVLNATPQPRPQAGNGHVNPLRTDVVAGLFSPLGYSLDARATAALRNASGSTGILWFPSNLMVLRRNQPVDVSPLQTAQPL